MPFSEHFQSNFATISIQFHPSPFKCSFYHSRAVPEQFQLVSEQFQCISSAVTHFNVIFRALSEQFCNYFNLISSEFIEMLFLPIQSSSRAVYEHFPSSFRAVSIFNPISYQFIEMLFFTIPEQFQSSFRAISVLF